MMLYQKLGSRQWIILALVIFTAVIHFFLPGILFVFNGLGYLGLIILYFVKFKFLPIPRKLIRWLFIGYTAITIAAYVIMQIQSGGIYVSPIGIFTKIVEIILIYLLVQENN